MPLALAALAGLFVAAADAAQAPAAEPAQSAFDAKALAAEIDQLYARRDEGEAPKLIEQKIGEALKAAPEDYEILWRASRWHFWVADGTPDGKLKEREGKLAWDMGDKAVAKDGKRAEGWYYAAIGLGVHSQAIGILSALAKGVEGKFLLRLRRAEELDRKLDNGGPSVSMGRYYFELPWPKYDSKKSIEWLKKTLAIEPRNARAHLYLAETYFKEGQAKEALYELNECLAIAPGTKDAPEERRVHALARALKPKIEKEAK